MKTKYSKDQRIAIESAWNAMLDIEYKISLDLEGALRKERKERSSILAAKAVLIRAFHPMSFQQENYGALNFSPQDWSRWTEGCATAAMAGYHAFHYKLIDSKYPALFERAIIAHNDAIINGLKSLSKESR